MRNELLAEIRQELIDTGQATPLLLDYLDDRIKQCIDNFMVNYLSDIDEKRGDHGE